MNKNAQRKNNQLIIFINILIIMDIYTKFSSESKHTFL